jgi:lipopolysaccharide assembly outer membrane protein LptD (OstA)
MHADTRTEQETTMKKALVCVAILLICAIGAVAQKPPKPSLSISALKIERTPDGGTTFSGNVVIIINGVRVTADKAVHWEQRNEIVLADGGVRLTLVDGLGGLRIERR